MTKYHSDNLLLPFFANDLFYLLENCLKLYKILQSKLLDSLTFIERIAAFHFNNTAHYSSVSKVSVGFIGDKC